MCAGYVANQCLTNVVGLFSSFSFGLFWYVKFNVLFVFFECSLLVYTLVIPAGYGESTSRDGDATQNLKRFTLW
jgi:hypothetical protein